jgi:hypothetical protein
MSTWNFWLVAMPLASVMALTVGLCLVRNGVCSPPMAAAQAGVAFGATHAALLLLRRWWWR